MSLFDKVKVVLGAVPAWGAAVTGLLTAFTTEVVPRLPGEWQVSVAAYAAAALGVVAAVVKTVSSVTPVLYQEDKGLLPNDSSPELTAFGDEDDV